MENGFPGKALYELLTGQNDLDRFAYSLSLPKDMRDYSTKADRSKGGWLAWKDRFECKDSAQDCFRQWWHSEGKGMIWIQRSYFFEMFSDYDPSSGRDDDKPYDLDHICPRSTWLNSIYEGKNGGDDKSTIKSAREGRYVLGNGIGNYWWIDSGLNRSLGDVPIKQKLQDDRLKDDRLKDVIKFAFDDLSLPQWFAASVERNQWTVPARNAFQAAVEERTLWLYERFFCDLGFEKWLEPSASGSNGNLDADAATVVT